MTWSRLVRTPAQARAALADPGDELDLRASAALDPHWEELGFTELLPGELVCPVEQRLADPEATAALGRRLAGELRPGDLVVLAGALGAGKTALTQGIGAGLGVRGDVTSPTFVLARTHPGPVPLLHVDVYRLLETGGRISLDDLALDDELPGAVTVVEWGEGVVEGLSDSRLHITLRRGPVDNGPAGPGKDGRSALVVPHGARWSAVQPP